MTISVDDLQLGMRVGATNRNGEPLNGDGLSVGVVESYRVTGKIEGVFRPIEHDQHEDMVQVRFDLHGGSGIERAQ
jgi:hypothetical protein